MSNFTIRFSLQSSGSQAGFSLVELMISLTIGLLLLSGLTTLIVQQSNTRSELDKSSRQIENGRYAIQVLHDDIQLAGFYGQYTSIPAPTGAMPNPCATDLASLNAAMSLPIQGYDALASISTPLSTCLNNANFLSGTDILVVRRVATATTTIANAAAADGGLVYLQATAASQVLNTGSGANTTNFPLTYNTSTNTGPADLRNYLVRIYFISPCNTMANGTTCTASDDNGKPIPTLKCLELSSTGGTSTFNLIPLVEGIQNLQLDYGIDSNSDGYPDSYVTTPATIADWGNVMAVRVNLLARNNDTSMGYTDTKTYSMGKAGLVGAFNDAYKRHAYSEVIRAVNPSGRRAQQ